MADWRTEIKTAGQKESYIRNVLEITAPKKSQEYRSAYQRLRFYAEGKTKEPTAPKYKKVESQAQVMADVKERKRGGGDGGGGGGGGGTPPHGGRVVTIELDTTYQISKDIVRRRKRVKLSRRAALRHAEAGEYFAAWVAEYFTPDMVDVVHELERHATILH